MSSCDKIINEALFERKDFFTLDNRKNMLAILTDMSNAMSHFKMKAKQNGHDITPEM